MCSSVISIFQFLFFIVTFVKCSASNTGIGRIEQIFKKLAVHAARFLKYVWPFYNIMHERVNWEHHLLESNTLSKWNIPQFPYFLLYVHVLFLIYLIFDTNIYGANISASKLFSLFIKHSITGIFWKSIYLKVNKNAYFI